MTKDRLLTAQEADDAGERYNFEVAPELYNEAIAQAQDAKTLKKILNRLEKANCEAVPEKRLAALEQALEEMRAELDAAQDKGKEG